jgi:cystathionine beta-lyase/cystathionine gamma-synthase
MEFETQVMHSGERPDKAYGAVSTPIYQTSNFVLDDVDKTRGYDYSRSGNPTRQVLEDTIARLEGGKAAFACSSGMAAESTVVHLLNSGDHVIATDDLYGGTYRLLKDIMPRFGIETTFVRMDSPAGIEAAIRPNTRMVWLETPSNPLLSITDMTMVASIAKKHKLLTVMDNTFASPFFQRPIEFGIDIVVHSTTKYLNGHCDVIGGAIVTSTDELSKRVAYLHNALGAIAGPFDSWLVLRGIETLPVRMKQHAANAMALAEYLQNHPKVEKVYYPGLPTHPGHELAKKQMHGFGGMLSFEVRGGVDAVNSFLRGIKLVYMAGSLGGTHSLAQYPARMSHSTMSPEYRRSVGIKDNLIRLSVGLENVEDLIADLKQALG